MPNQENTPYLSVVVTCRNDDHGGNLKARMQVFLNDFIEQCRRFNLKAELVIVEWNPPAGRPRIIDSYDWPANPGPCSVRIIEVPAEIHQSFPNSDRLPLFQMIGKNVGIRRSRGKFALATNIDLVFSDSLMDHLAAEQLNTQCFYRIDRHDVPAELSPDAGVSQHLAFCEQNLLRVHKRNGTKNLTTTGEFRRIYPNLRGVLGDIENFGWHVVNLAATAKRRLRTDPDYRRSLLVRADIERQLRKFGTSLVKRLRRTPKILHEGVFAARRARLHTNASGDFTLMATEKWFELQGYPEMAMYSFHLDSVLCYMAYYVGLTEVVFPDPMRIYHIEHTAGWTPEAATNDSFDRRLKDAGIPRMSDEELDRLAVQMEVEKRPVRLNNDAWGLACVDLPETEVYSRQPAGGSR